MKTSDLTGAQLDYWVARAEGWEHVSPILLRKVEMMGLAKLETLITTSRSSDYGGGRKPIFYSPSTIWGLAGPIIERKRIDLIAPTERDPEWGAVASKMPGGMAALGETALIAAMRAVVASKFGPEVPDEVTP